MWSPLAHTWVALRRGSEFPTEPPTRPHHMRRLATIRAFCDISAHAATFRRGGQVSPSGTRRSRSSSPGVACPRRITHPSRHDPGSGALTPGGNAGGGLGGRHPHAAATGPICGPGRRLHVFHHHRRPAGTRAGRLDLLVGCLRFVGVPRGARAAAGRRQEAQEESVYHPEKNQAQAQEGEDGRAQVLPSGRRQQSRAPAKRVPERVLRRGHLHGRTSGSTLLRQVPTHVGQVRPRHRQAINPSIHASSAFHATSTAASTAAGAGAGVPTHSRRLTVAIHPPRQPPGGAHPPLRLGTHPHRPPVHRTRHAVPNFHVLLRHHVVLDARRIGQIAQRARLHQVLHQVPLDRLVFPRLATAPITRHRACLAATVTSALASVIPAFLHHGKTGAKEGSGSMKAAQRCRSAAMPRDGVRTAERV
eukprot:ctg_628.g153